MACVAADHEAPVELFDEVARSVAVLVGLQEAGEVLLQPEVVELKPEAEARVALVFAAVLAGETERGAQIGAVLRTRRVERIRVEPTRVAGLDVVQAQHARQVVARACKAAVNAKAPLLAAKTVLEHRGAIDAVTILAEAVGPSKLKRAKRIGVTAFGREDRDLPERPERTQVGLRVDTPLLDTELVVDRTRDREVALFRVIHTFGDTKLPHHLRDDEALVGVPLPVDV